MVRQDDLTNAHLTQWARKALQPAIEFTEWLHYALLRADKTLKLAHKVVNEPGSSYGQGFFLAVEQIEQIHKRLTELATVHAQLPQPQETVASLEKLVPAEAQ